MTLSTTPKKIKLHPWSLEYLRLKLLVSVFRFLALARPLIRPKPEPLPSTHERVLVQIPSRDARRTIKAYVHRPKSHRGRALPVHVTFHGSGFVLDSLGEDAVFVNHLIHRLGPDLVVIDADYRKAPEWPFPAAPNDAEDVLAHVLSRPDAYDPRRVTVGGFSAGGNLALVAASAFGPEKIAAVTSLYPVTDFLIPADKRRLKADVKPESGLPLPPWMSRLFNQSYFVDTAHKKDSAASVISRDPSSFPPTLVACGEVDTLYYDSQHLADKLAAAGIKSRFISIEQEGHGFDKLCKTQHSLQRREHVYSAFADWIQQAWDKNQN
ncbi:alpha/beta-hydrolase [Testicularia cyperi]|uniref:Alpha/beta-hydrolase n=1 Tax=Testicularia cyperi TaxID=1882483 RepID=A0A317XSB6_9BASI|nr:alpha/beta-hydrolase [Testicularia cyperi]